jgi:hypothetical protein
MNHLLRAPGRPRADLDDRRERRGRRGRRGRRDVHPLDAAQVRAFAEEKDVAWVSMWSTFRDRQCEDGGTAQDDAATDCAG